MVEQPTYDRARRRRLGAEVSRFARPPRRLRARPDSVAAADPAQAVIIVTKCNNRAAGFRRRRRCADRRARRRAGPAPSTSLSRIAFDGAPRSRPSRTRFVATRSLTRSTDCRPGAGGSWTSRRRREDVGGATNDGRCPGTQAERLGCIALSRPTRSGGTRPARPQPALARLRSRDESTSSPRRRDHPFPACARRRDRLHDLLRARYDTSIVRTLVRAPDISHRLGVDRHGREGCADRPALDEWQD